MSHGARTLAALRALHGFTGDLGEELRTDGLCYNCDGQGKVFPGLPGRPTIPDTSRIVTCPICDGSGKRKPQMPLF